MTSTVLVPFAASSVAQARHQLREDLRGHRFAGSIVDDALLVLSELLSNALKHARPLPSGRLRVRWSLATEALEIEVTDGGGPTRPRVNVAASVSSTGGRGLSIVGDLSREWGVHEDEGTSTVWAVVAPHSAPDGLLHHAVSGAPVRRR